MPPVLIHFIGNYGYLAIFLLIFLQEIGVPNPVPNEIVLLFSGSLGATGILSFPLVFIVVVAADILGALLLYGVFYIYGQPFLDKIPLPMPKSKLHHIEHEIARRGWWGVFLGRLLPFFRGYASVVAGLTRIKFHVFITSVTVSAVVWSGGIATVGRILGIYWTRAESVVKQVELAVVVGIIALIAWFMVRSRMNRNTKQ